MSDSASAVEVTILVDNNAPEGLASEHGLSVWIESEGRRLLFDTGQGPALSDNASKLGIALSSADAVILSHGHYDHTGGVPFAVESAPRAHLYCHPGTTIPRYAIRDGGAKSIGMPDSAKEALSDLPRERTHFITEPVEIGEGIGITGPVPRLTNYEDTGGPFFLDADATQADPLDDDLALWIRTDAGLLVVVGCSHAGLVNTLIHAKRLSGTPKIHAVVGGFHLMNANVARIERTVSALRQLDPDVIVPCHCTGDRAVGRLREVLGDCVLLGSAGTICTFAGTRERTIVERT
jgi:7,8-dihydropterin-6-yl-methyl-4-(beta-D-ribofuranosyl)aminobenzene 5'-phosphate synthase